MFAKTYLATAVSLLEKYTGNEPFHLYLKKYYGVFKKFGSRDRKAITQLCYCWFRAGHALAHLQKDQQVIYALFICSDGETKLLQELDARLNSEAAKPLEEKLKIAEAEVGFQRQHLFPWQTLLSPEIEPHLFNQSMLVQPHVYLRLRPGKEGVVTTTLRDNNIAFEKISNHCLSISNSTKADAVLQLDKDAVVQDLNSQRVLELINEHGVLKKINPERAEGFTAWDCCAASGGKSLLLADTFSKAHITASDVRASILHNLRNRFQRAGINQYRWFVGDATKDAPPQQVKFDLIICDAPCSGSGTWSRTPEQLHYFNPDKINAYAQLQKSILNNVSHYLKPGGLLLYATCSVFKKENEDVIEFASKNGRLHFLKSAYYTGYDKRADTLFAALFKAL